MNNSVAIITGSARGIGKAIAKELHHRGLNITINYHHSKNEANKLVNELNNKRNNSVIAIGADITDSKQVRYLFSESKRYFKQNCDILVNNSGCISDNIALRMSDEEWLRVIDLNLNGTFYCIREALRDMMRSDMKNKLNKNEMNEKKYKIINISSIVGEIGNIGQANYAAAKGGVIALTKSLAKEYLDKNICINAICPGLIETEMSEHLINSNKNIKKGKPEDIASLVSYLALDPASSYITGSIFNIDGGESFQL